MSSSSALKLTALSLSTVALASAAILWHPVAVSAQAAPNTAAYYTANVKPIFEKNCYRCHGNGNHRGGLVLDTQAGMLKGGKDGAVIAPGHPEDSLLIKLIRHEGPADDPMPMPPKGDKISDADIAVVTAWVKAGAVMPPDAAQ